MTGRDLILHILTNNLEDEPIVQDGKLVGFLTISEVAERFHVGTATVEAWIMQKRLDHVILGDRMYIPINFKSQFGCVMG